MLLGWASEEQGFIKVWLSQGLACSRHSINVPFSLLSHYFFQDSALSMFLKTQLERRCSRGRGVLVADPTGPSGGRKATFDLVCSWSPPEMTRLALRSGWVTANEHCKILQLCKSHLYTTQLCRGNSSVFAHFPAVGPGTSARLPSAHAGPARHHLSDIRGVSFLYPTSRIHPWVLRNQPVSPSHPPEISSHLTELIISKGSWFCHLPAVWSQARHLPSLSLSFFIGKVHGNL